MKKKTHYPHPGEMIAEEFMKPHGLTMYRLARMLGVPDSRIQRIMRGTAPLDFDTAQRLDILFGARPGYFLGFQTQYDRLTNPLPKEAMAKIEKARKMLPAAA